MNAKVLTLQVSHSNCISHSDIVGCKAVVITVAILPMRKLRLREIVYPVSGTSSFETQAYMIYKFSTLCSVVIHQIALKNFTRQRLE